MRGDDGVYNLALLQDDACLPLFTRHALGKENFDAHPNLQDVGEKLVKRCKRLPLALKTLGGVLRGKLRRDEWENVLKSDIWSSSEDGSGILLALRLSYNHLPFHLKRCFAYCALFPQNYEFKEKELVLLWMAEGLLQQQSRGKKQIEEEIGHQYFHELLSRSLFQQSSTNKSQFVMHDLINDLAVDVGGEIYCNLERSMGNEKLDNAHHFSFTPHSYEISKKFRVLDTLKHLRTFLLLRRVPNVHSDYIFFKRILYDFLPTLNCLRGLSLCDYQINKLPDSFENLKHMRYINLSGISIKCIPESVGSFLFLQTLLLCGCRKLSKLPMTIGNLIDLHHLDITDTPSLIEMPSGIGNLKNLVTLSKFIVGKASGMMTRLSDLKNLSQLQGRLSILDLQNVFDVQDAREANLDKIHGLEELVLEWIALDNDRDESVLAMQVLSLLKPHSNLKSLKISCYGGENFPKWVCDPLLFFNLSSMELRNCERCTLLPSLGLLPFLKELIIEGMGSIEAIGSEFYGQHGSFPLLAELVFRNMPKWREWTSPAGGASEFPCLHKLVIENCPKLLGQLPSNLSSLKELYVSSCNGKLLKSMGDFPFLTYLGIEQISKLTCLPVSMSLPSLKELYIGNCNGVLLKSMGDFPSLTYLGIEQISELTCLPMSMSLPSLKELSIGDCNGVLLKSMVDLTSLTNLRIEQISELTCLPMSMSLPSLKELHIENCNTMLLKGMVYLTSLTILRIEQISELTCLPMSMSLPSLKELFIRNCNKVLLESMVDLTSLTNLRIEQISELTCLPMSMSLPSLKELHIENCNRVLLKSMVYLTSLTILRIEQISELTCLPESFTQSWTALETLDIAHCNDLTCLWEEGTEIEQSLLPFNLKHLSLKYCRACSHYPMQ
ncbi:hypothetical protein SLA2020_052700 [Shorea laevis]